MGWYEGLRARARALAACALMAAAVLLGAPRTALAYSVSYSSDWEDVPASTIELITPLLGLPDTYETTGGLKWIDSGTDMYLTSSTTPMTNHAGGVFFKVSPTSTATQYVSGTATLIWENVGYDATGTTIDLVLEITDVSYRASATAVSEGEGEYASIFAVRSEGTCLMDASLHTEPFSYASVYGSSGTATISLVQHGTSTPASGRYLFFMADIDSYNSVYSESVTLLSGFESTVYLYTGSKLSVSTSTEEQDTYSADKTYTSGWSSAANVELSTVIATSVEATFSFIWSGSRCSTVLFDSLFSTITATSGSNGSITDEGDSYANWKCDKSYTATANDGYAIEELLVDDGQIGEATGQTSYTYTFESVTSDHSISVTYAPIQYSVSFDANGGTGSMGDLSMTYDEEAELTANVFTRTGYAFSGWNTQADGSGTGYADGETVKNLADEEGATVVLYAQWEPIQYTVSFDANGGTGGPDDLTAVYDTACEVPSDAPTRDGYVFCGWNTQADGSGDGFSAGDELFNLTSTDGATITLYAQWEPVICVSVPTEVACVILPSGEVLEPTGYEIENLSLVDVVTTIDGITCSDVTDGTQTHVSYVDGDESYEVFNTSEGYLAAFSIGAQSAQGLDWTVDDLDAVEDAELLEAAASGVTDVCYVTFTFEAA